MDAPGMASSGWLLLGWLLLRWLFLSIFADFEQVKNLVVILLALNKSKKIY